MKDLGVKRGIVLLVLMVIASMFMTTDVYAAYFTEVIIEDNKYNDICLANGNYSAEIFDADYVGVVTRTRKVEVVPGDIILTEEYIGTEGIVSRYIYSLRYIELPLELDIPTEDEEEIIEEENKDEEEPKQEIIEEENKDEEEPEQEIIEEENKDEEEPEQEKVIEEKVYVPYYVNVLPVVESEVEESEETEEIIEVRKIQEVTNEEHAEGKKEVIVEEKVPSLIKPVPEPKYENDVIASEKKMTIKSVKKDVTVLEEDVVPLSNVPKTGDISNVRLYFYLMMGALFLVCFYIKSVEKQRKLEESKIPVKNKVQDRYE